MAHHAKQLGTECYRQEAREVVHDLLAHGLVPNEKREVVERLLDEEKPTEALHTALSKIDR